MVVAPFGLCLALVLVIFRAYWIPTGSMKPTLVVGDYVFANRLTYGFPALMCRLGLCDQNMGPLGRTVAAGDVAVFKHPVTSRHFVKRIIGLPGDRIQMKEGVPYVNGRALSLEPDGLFSETYDVAQGFMACNNAPVAPGEVCTKSKYQETLPDGRSYWVLNIAHGMNGDDTEEFLVPEGHVFALGDNRDNSKDSRMSADHGGIGFVALDRMIGRVDFILLSLDGVEGRAFRRVQ